MNPRRWWGRVAAGVVLVLVLEITFVVVDLDPDLLRLVLLVAVGVASGGLLLDTLDAGAPSWRADPVRPTAREGDRLLARNVSLIQGHLTARSTDAALRDRLAGLADQVLRQRHGVTLTDPRAAALLGPEASGLLTGPVRRLDRRQIDHCLTRIEEL